MSGFFDDDEGDEDIYGENPHEENDNSGSNEEPVAKEKKDIDTASVKKKEERKEEKKVSKATENTEENKTTSSGSNASRSLKDKIVTLNDKSDVVTILLVIEELIFELKKSSSYNNEKVQDRKVLEKRLNLIYESVSTTVTELKNANFNQKATNEKMEEILESFQKDFEDLVNNIDLASLEKALLININDILKKLPVNALNDGITTSLTLLRTLKETLTTWKDDAQEFEKKLYKQRKEFKVILDDVDDFMRSMKKEIKEYSKNKYSLTHMFLSSFIFSFFTLMASIYVYQDFLGNKIDSLLISVQKSANNKSNIQTFKDDAGTYILYDKKKFKMTKKNGEVRFYIRKK